MLRAVPSPCARALDVGCGEGQLTRRLAGRCEDVVGIDLHPPVLSAVSQAEPANVRFVAGDVMTAPLPAEGFDFIAAIAVLHHLPLREGLARLQSLLKPGGALVVVGLYRAGTVADALYAAAATPVSWAVRRLRGYGEVQACQKRPEDSLADVRQVARALLPGAVLQRRLFFRYSLIWRKPL